MSDEYEWSVHEFENNKDSYKWWIKSHCKDNYNQKKINWITFKKIVYNIWYYSYFETSIKKQFKQTFPDYHDDDGKDDDEEEFSISVDQLQEFIENMNFGLNDALIRSNDRMLSLCFNKIDENR